MNNNFKLLCKRHFFYFIFIFISFFFLSKTFFLGFFLSFPSLSIPSQEMGIPGLLTALHNVTKYVHLSEFSGKTIAVDAYCWLHKAAFCCAQELCLGVPTEKYRFSLLNLAFFCFIDTLSSV